MTIVRTDLGDTRESARRIRFEQAGTNLATDVQEAIENVGAATSGAVTSTSVTFAMSPYVPLASDSYLYVNTSGGAVTINLAAAAARSGIPLIIKDVSGNALTNNITVNPNGAETIDGLAPYTINSDFGGIRLNPRTGVGYTVSP